MPNCPQCGAELGSGDPAGLCPKCLILGAFDSSAGAEECSTETLDSTSAAAGDDDFGRYRIVRSLGEGGMGTVYLAEQREPIRRRVALKVVKLGMDTSQVLARFDNERQALAMMDHPNIAKVFDAGATDTGRPFFVMELVRGTRITDYCDQANLSTSDRLDLFIKVCQAIQHAHQKGIIHRDIKPSNILVTLHDGVPVPKVIDFGIAKATGQQLTDRTLYTGLAQMVGTPQYMSPEQATGDPLVDRVPAFFHRPGRNGQRCRLLLTGFSQQCMMQKHLLRPIEVKTRWSINKKIGDMTARMRTSLSSRQSHEPRPLRTFWNENTMFSKVIAIVAPEASAGVEHPL
jgi:serine/threonine protein kinase